MNWLLILYISSGFGTASTGGPTSIDGFASQNTCEIAGKNAMNTVKKIDWYQCVLMQK